MGVRRFLSEFSSDKTNKTLNDWLTKEHETNFENERIPLPKTAQYWLFKTAGVVKSDNLGEGGFSYHKNHFLINKTMILGLDLNIHDDDGSKIDAYLYFLWLKEKHKWKIVDAGMLCQ